MKKDLVTKKVLARVKKQSHAIEEFDSFMIEWIDKYELPEEAYRGISYLMSSYVTNEIQD